MMVVQDMWHRLTRRLRAFRADTSGQIMIIFALSSVAIFAGLGAGIDLAKAYAARQRLSEVATLACQYSTRPSVAQTAVANYAGTNGFQTYVNAINTFATTTLSSEKWGAASPTGAGGTAGVYFTATPAAGGSTTAGQSPTNPVVEMYANVPTAFSQIVNVPTIQVHAKISCQTLATAPQVVNPGTLLQEGFETPCAFYCFTNPSGGSVTIATALQTFPPTYAYIGSAGYKWYIVGYCLETDVVGVINSSVPEGTHAAELDCDNGSGSKGNSSISTKVYMEAGQYELRYNYRSRVDYPDYDPTYVCGSTASDVSWANDTSGISPPTGLGVSRTNQINVYLDANIAGTNGTTGSAPLHQTLDGTQYLAGSNLIDECVYSPTWIERSIRIKIANPGYYWVSFAADGTSDSYGAQLDNIRLCQELCTGNPQDNFPSAWTGKTLFEDTFEAPVYTTDPYTSWPHAKGGNLSVSTGTSGTAASGWPNLGASGWNTAPYNEVVYIMQGAYQGTQYITMDGWNGFETSPTQSTNRMTSRPFLLDPGYYNVSYNYISDLSFTSLGNYGVFCTAAPASGTLYPALGTSYPGTARFIGTTTADVDTNILGVFMSHSQLVSTPNPSTPVPNGTVGSVTTYTNPDGSTSTTPTVPPDGVNWQSYTANVVNPVIDTCGNAYNFQWVPRSVNIKVTKPGFYWLTFSTKGGAADSVGPGIDDVKLTALGSPYMSNPPTTALTNIPVPTPQPDTSYTPGSYPGFTIVADPFTPPGADQ